MITVEEEIAECVNILTAGLMKALKFYFDFFIHCFFIIMPDDFNYFLAGKSVELQ